MNEVALDASVVLKWFRSHEEPDASPAEEIRSRILDGTLTPLAPGLLWLEMLNVASRKWNWDGKQLASLAKHLPGMGFRIEEPTLGAIARWCDAGLTAYDASYVAVAENAGVNLVTADREIVRLAGGIATPLVH